MSRKGDATRAAFVSVGIPAEQADNALLAVPEASLTKQADVNALLNSVGYADGIIAVPEATPQTTKDDED